MNGKEQINTHQTIIEIFKTNVNNEQLANRIICGLNHLYPNYLINFDLEDCDKVLRVALQKDIDVFGIINFARKNTIQIEIIDY